MSERRRFHNPAMAFFLFSILFFIPGISPVRAQEATAVILDMQGPVFYRAADSDPWTQTQPGQTIPDGGSLAVKGSAKATMQLNNGSLIRIQEYSVVKIQEITDEQGTKIPVFDVQFGTATVGPKGPMVCTTGLTSILPDRGIASVAAASDFSTSIKVFSRKIRIRNPNNGELIESSPGEIVTLSLQQASPVIRKESPEQSIFGSFPEIEFHLLDGEVLEEVKSSLTPQAWTAGDLEDIGAPTETPPPITPEDIEVFGPETPETGPETPGPPTPDAPQVVQINVSLQVEFRGSPLPEITSISVNGVDVASGSRITIKLSDLPDGRITVEGAAGAPQGELASVEMSEDGATWTSAGAETWSFSRTPSGAKTYSFLIRAINTEGKMSEQSSLTVEVQKSEPPEILAVRVNDQEAVVGETIQIPWASAREGIAIAGESGSAEAKIVKTELSTDNGSTWGSVGEAAWTKTMTYNDPGVYSLSFRTQDNQAQYSSTIKFSVEILPPSPPSVMEVTVNGNPADQDASVNYTMAEISAGIEIAASAQGEAGIQALELSTNGGAAWNTIGGESGSFKLSPSAPATYSIAVRAKDSRGQNSELYSFTIEIAAVSAPVITEVSAGEEKVEPGATVSMGFTEASKGIEISVQAQASGDLEIKTLEISSNGGASWNTIGGESGALTLTPAQPVTYSMSVRAVDSLNQASETFSFSIEVKASVPPSITEVVVGDETANQSAVVTVPLPQDGEDLTISGTAESPEGELSGVEISVNGGAAWTQAQGAEDWSFDLAVDSPKSFQVRVRAMDAAGLTSAVFAFELKVEKPACAPVIEEVYIGEQELTELMTEDISWSDTEAGKIKIKGTAKSDCGEIKKINVTVNDQKGVSEGADEWEYSYKVELGYYPPPGIENIEVLGQSADDIPEGELLFKDDLRGGKIRITGNAEASENIEDINIELVAEDEYGNRSAPMKFAARLNIAGISMVEVSVDDGATWQRANETEEWSYEFIPRHEAEYGVQARAVDVSGQKSETGLDTIRIVYFNRTREELLKESFQRLLAAFENADSSSLLDLVDDDFSSSEDSIKDKGEMENSLDQRFHCQVPAIDYTIDNALIGGDGIDGVVSFTWNNSQHASQLRHSARFTFQLDVETRAYLLYKIEDPASFFKYTSATTAEIPIEIEADDLYLTANSEDTTTIHATVFDDAGNLAADDTVVRFASTNGAIEASDTTTCGVAQAEYTASHRAGTANITASSGAAGSNTVRITLEEEPAPLPPGE